MNKINKVTQKTHAYILPEYDGTVVRAISEAHIKDYQKEGKQVYSAPATKIVDGVKTDVQNYYVAVADFVKRSTARTGLKDKLAATIAGIDVSKLSADERNALLALVG